MQISSKALRREEVLKKPHKDMNLTVWEDLERSMGTNGSMADRAELGSSTQAQSG